MIVPPYNTYAYVFIAAAALFGLSLIVWILCRFFQKKTSAKIFGILAVLSFLTTAVFAGLWLGPFYASQNSFTDHGNVCLNSGDKCSIPTIGGFPYPDKYSAFVASLADPKSGGIYYDASANQYYSFMVPSDQTCIIVCPNNNFNVYTKNSKKLDVQTADGCGPSPCAKSS